MPPAFVLSQDQTLKLMSQYNGTGDNSSANRHIELREPIPALVKRMDTKDMYDIGLLTGYCSPKTRRPGAVAHMSLHLKPTMSKNHQTTTTPAKPAQRQKQPDNNPSRFSNPRDRCPSMLATGRNTSTRSGVPFGEAAYMETSRVGQGPNSTSFPRPDRLLGEGKGASQKPRGAAISTLPPHPQERCRSAASRRRRRKFQ